MLPGVLHIARWEVAETGSIRKAADKLFVSPSSVNRQILNLEEHIGTTLFDRESKGMRPTRSGEIILAAAREFSRSMKDALDQVSSLRGLGKGRVSFGTLTTFAETFAAPLIVRLRKAHPGLGIFYYAGNSSEIVQKVLEGDLDFGLCWDPPPSTPLHRIDFVEVPIGVAMRPSHPMAKLATIRLKDCLESPVVFPSRGMEFRGVLDRINLGMGNVVSPVVEANSIPALRRLSLVGDEPVMMTANAIIDEIENGELAFTPLSDPGCGRLTLSLFRRDVPTSSPAAVALLEQLQAEISYLKGKMCELFAEAPPKGGSTKQLVVKRRRKGN
jgi:DNA-binding transcriptional LysR family regulator